MKEHITCAPITLENGLSTRSVLIFISFLVCRISKLSTSIRFSLILRRFETTLLLWQRTLRSRLIDTWYCLSKASLRYAGTSFTHQQIAAFSKYSIFWLSINVSFYQKYQGFTWTTKNDSSPLLNNSTIVTFRIRAYNTLRLEMSCSVPLLALYWSIHLGLLEILLFLLRT